MTENNIYEIGLLINPNLSQQEAEAGEKKVQELVSKAGASVISNGELVDMDLAYQIITKIASKNHRFDTAFFGWVKIDAEADKIEIIKKSLDRIKTEVFRYLIVKSVEDDSLTDKFNLGHDEEVMEEEKTPSAKVEKGAEKIVEEKTEVKEEIAAKEESSKPDDLTKVEGIGPVTAKALVAHDIKTFKDLSEAAVEKLKEILSENKRLSKFDPTTWPAQSKMAAEGQWDELKAWQDELNGGE